MGTSLPAECPRRGPESTQGQLFSDVSLAQRIPADHPWRTLKALVEPVLSELAPRFEGLHAERRAAIDPRLLRKLRHRRRETVDWIFIFTMAAYDLVRIGTLVRGGVCT